jgi:hypothetical protein
VSDGEIERLKRQITDYRYEIDNLNVKIKGLEWLEKK